MSLVCWLPLNGDLHHYGCSTLNLTNNVTFSTTGKIGEKCLNSQLGWFTVPEMDNKKQMSFAYWVKINEGTTTNWLDTFSWYSTDGSSATRSRQEFYYYNSDTQVMTTGVWYAGSSNSGLTQRKIGQWYHYAFTIDYTTGISNFYVDGTLFKTTTNVNKAHYIRPGASQFLLRESALNSSINDFRLYDHCLSAAEVREISQGLILHYKLDNITNGIQDSSGYNHNGIIHGTITLQNNTPRYTRCISTNANDTYIDAGIVKTAERKFSFNLWANSTSLPTGAKYLIIKLNDTTYFNFGRTGNSGSSGQFLIFNGSNYIGVNGGFSFPTGEWHMWSGTFDGTTVKVYQDGQLLKSSTATSNYGYTLPEKAFILGTGSAAQLGSISDVRVYCSVLSDEEILQLYQLGAKIDNKQNLHTFELIEDESSIKVTKRGQVKCDDLTEATTTKFYKSKDINTNNLIEL